MFLERGGPKLSFFEAFGLLPGEDHAMQHSEISKYRDDPEHGSHAIGQRSNDEQHDSFGPLHKPDLAGRNDVFGTGPGVADHHRRHHHDSGQDDVGSAVDAAVVDQQTISRMRSE